MTSAATESRPVPAERPRDPRHFRLPLFLFGVGLGGFVDGIVIHQLLQWHHMVSDTPGAPMDTVLGLERNTLADGLFHAGAFVVVLVALLLAMRTKRADASAVLPSIGVVVGWLLVGWGSFNLVEGLVDHHLLEVHHVRDDVAEPIAWDVGFLAVSALLLALGTVLVARGRRHPDGLRRLDGTAHGGGRVNTLDDIDDPRSPMPP